MEFDKAEQRLVFIPTSSGDMQEAKDYKAVWNLSQNSLACIASKDYNIIQHNFAVDSLVEALKGLNIKHQLTAKSQGHRIFVDVTFPDTKLYVSQGEEFIGGLRLINSYDKTTGLLVLPRLMRMVCSNGMIVDKAVMDGYSIKHTQKIVEDFKGMVEKMLNGLINSSVTLKAMVNDCLADSVEWKVAENVFENLIKRKKHIEEIQKLLPQGKVTRWDCYNAITQYATHGEQIKPNVEAWLQTKAQKLLTTPLETLSVEVPIASRGGI